MSGACISANAPCIRPKWTAHTTSWCASATSRNGQCCSQISLRFPDWTSSLGDPVAAWEETTADPERTARYKQARGKGGFVRASWPEVTELIAAAHVATTKNYDPDRVVGFSPIPAISQVCYSAGTRFLSMIGGTILSFSDWYADMPSPPHRCSATRPTCPSPGTGGTPPT